MQVIIKACLRLLPCPGQSLTHDPDTISNELYQDTNVALLCEDIVNGMIAANEFRGTGSPDAPRSISSELLSRNHQHSHDLHHHPLKVIVDIEKRDWDFKVQPGISPCFYLSSILLTSGRRPSKGSDEHLRQCTEIYPIWIHNVETACCGE